MTETKIVLLREKEGIVIEVWEIGPELATMILRQRFTWTQVINSLPAEEA